MTSKGTKNECFESDERHLSSSSTPSFFCRFQRSRFFVASDVVLVFVVSSFAFDVVSLLSTSSFSSVSTSSSFSSLSMSSIFSLLSTSSCFCRFRRPRFSSLSKSVFLSFMISSKAMKNDDMGSDEMMAMSKATKKAKKDYVEATLPRYEIHTGFQIGTVFRGSNGLPQEQLHHSGEGLGYSRSQGPESGQGFGCTKHLIEIPAMFIHMYIVRFVSTRQIRYVIQDSPYSAHAQPTLTPYSGHLKSSSN